MSRLIRATSQINAPTSSAREVGPTVSHGMPAKLNPNHPRTAAAIATHNSGDRRRRCTTLARSTTCCCDIGEP